MRWQNFEHIAFLWPRVFVSTQAMAEPPLKKRKGGVKQRIAAAERECTGPEVADKSSLASFLLEKWAWGVLSPQDVQQFAAAACQNFLTSGARAPADLSFMASLGTAGAHKNNMHKQLMHWANRRCKEAAPSFTATIRFKEPYGRQIQSFLLPHQLFSNLYHEYPSSWKQIILPSTDRLKEFWKLQKQHPACSTVSSLPSFPSKLIPIAFHGDGTPVIGLGKIWSRALTIFRMNSILGIGVDQRYATAYLELLWWNHGRSHIAWLLDLAGLVSDLVEKGPLARRRPFGQQVTQPGNAFKKLFYFTLRSLHGFKISLVCSCLLQTKVFQRQCARKESIEAIGRWILSHPLGTGGRFRISKFLPEIASLQLKEQPMCIV